MLSRIVLFMLVVSPLLSEAKLVIFGDSFSDNGIDGILAANELVNNFFSTGPVNVGVYPAAPYYQGRFTNGFIWADEAARILGQEVDNYACAGSNSNSGQIVVEPPFAYVTTQTPVAARSLVQQAQAYAALNANAAPGRTDTVVIFFGQDEYQQHLQGVAPGPPDANDVLGAIQSSLSIAYGAGARSFVVFNLPPLSSIPYAASVDQNAANSVTAAHNSQLETLLSNFNTTNAGVSTLVYDINGLFSAVLASPGNFGAPAFTNTTGPCRGGLDVSASQAAGFSLPNCPNGDAYVFWDSAHPSKHMHLVIGQDFATKTSSKTSASLTQ